MFNADGKRLLKEKDTGTFTEQLRSLHGDTLKAEHQEELDKLAAINNKLDALKEDRNLVASKTLQQILKLLKAYTERIKQMDDKVDTLEEGFQLMTRNFFTDANRLIINVPVKAQHTRAFVMPHEQDSRKKRKMPGPRRPEDKKKRRMRALKPQKIAAKQTRRKKVVKSRWPGAPEPNTTDTDTGQGQILVPVKLEVPNVDPTRAFAALPRLLEEEAADVKGESWEDAFAAE
jgi:hypothetical protein